MKIVQDVNKAIEVMHGVGTWMRESGLNPNQWWRPENMNSEFLLKYTEPNEYYVALIDDKPAASMVLQETERNQSWRVVDGDMPKQALYVHWLCVARDFAGQGLSNQLMEFAVREGRERGFSLLRLDTDADEKKLCDIYEGTGFTLMSVETKDDRKTAFYQREI